MRRRTRLSAFLAPLLALALLLAPSAGGVAVAQTPSGQYGTAGTGANESVADLLKDLNASLKSENETLSNLNKMLQAEVEALKQENALLRKQLEIAVARLLELEGGSGSDSGSSSSSGSPAGNVEQLANRLRPRVFMIEVFGPQGTLVSSGSAVAVTKTDVVTNYHVIDEAWSAELVTESGQRIPVEGMTAYDEANDLALLRVNGTLEPVTLRNTAARVGEEVVAIGSPLGLLNTVSTGIVSAVRTLGGQEMIQITAPTWHGSSGGGLFDKQGNLIGITSGGMREGQNLNFAIPVKFVQQLMQRAGSPQPLPGFGRGGAAELAAFLNELFPEMIVNGETVPVQYFIMPNENARPWEAPEYIVAVLDTEAHYNLAKGMVVGDLRANEEIVEFYMWVVASSFNAFYPPEQDVTLLLVHVGEYPNYPTTFSPNEVEYDPKTGTYWVFKPILSVHEHGNENWHFEWLIYN